MVQMNLNYIKSFYYVAKLGSISRAARQLNLAQPTVTKKIQLLEEEIGQTLITRNARGAELTDEGKIFYSHASKVIEELNHLEHQFFEKQPDQLSITSTQGIGAYLLPKAVSGVDEVKVPLDILIRSELNAEELFNTDLYIGPFVEGLDRTHRFQFLHDFDFHFYASKEYLQKNGTPKTASELKDHQFISFADERRDAFEETNLSFLLTDPKFQKPLVKTKSAFAEIDLTARGLGIALLSDVGVKHFQSKVQKLELEDFDGVKTPVYAFVKKDTDRDKASFIQKLLGFFQSDLTQLSL